MQIIRHNVFETNSSSTHSLIYTNSREDYLPASDKIIVNFIDTNDEYHLTTLRDKVSYLVSHIINNYKYDCLSYKDLIDQVQRDDEFNQLANYVQKNFNKIIVFPETYHGYLEDIVNINHQLYSRHLYDVLEGLVRERDYLGEVLSEDTIIEIGRD